MKDNELYYSVGALLYCPANNKSIAHSVIQEKFGTDYSLALCLEDTINDRCVPQAEQALLHSLEKIYRARETRRFFLPHIYVRVRNAGQMKRLLQDSAAARELLRGFILPKFDPDNADAYLDATLQVNGGSRKTYYIMPIMESPALIPLNRRADILYKIKEMLDHVEDYVLNIRVGGNDLCHAFGLRRNSSQSIHAIRPVSNILSDIFTVFGMNYVVSGPVWEYYNGTGWDAGLYQELLDDRLCGFVGKTAIHPKQIPLINQAYQVSPEDLADAKAILGWDDTAISFVSASMDRQRMNECKTHTNWAKKTIFLSHVYGVT